ncbi:MAG: FtsW/RodA/SpoVE family cell cycle protein [Spirochaetota bacterium]
MQDNKTLKNNNNIIIDKPDNILFIVIIFLLGFGIIMVYSASMTTNIENLFLKQFISLGISILGLIVFSFLNHNILFKYNVYLLLISIILLILVMLPPFGVVVGNARRWINIGFIQFQPSELAKLALIIYLSVTITNKGIKVKRFVTGFLPLLVVMISVFILILIGPDFSTATLLLLTGLSIFYVGGIKFIYIVLSILFSLPLLLGLTLITDYRLDRIKAFLNPFLYSDSTGYQSIRFMKALANGEVFGMGFGNGIQKHYIPYSFNDSIFSVIAEEVGFIGSLIVILFYLLFAYRGYLISFNAPTKSSRLLAFGLTTLITFQALINFSVVIGWIPITGITLPFISFGGTSLVITSISAGILLNISKYKIKR